MKGGIQQRDIIDPTIVSSWVSIQGHRNLFDILPEPLHKFWGKWELRALVVLSLLSQITLLLVAARRSHQKDRWIKVLVWCAYMTAEWVPTFATGVISTVIGDYYDKSRQQKGDMDPQLIAFWAPFFLIHLGGPHTITAYALEDHELWLRHLVSLVSESLLISYLILLSWKSTTNWLSYLSFPMLIIGIIKYKDRIRCLYSGRISHLRDSFLVAVVDDTPHADLKSGLKKMFEDMGLFISLSTDVVLTPRQVSLERAKFLATSHDEAFKRIRKELKFTYQVLYTKKSLIDEYPQSFTTNVGKSGIAVVFILYCVYIGSHQYSLMDHVITIVLLSHVLISDAIAYFRYNILFYKPILGDSVERDIEHIESLTGERPSGNMVDLLEQCNLLSIWNEENSFGNPLLNSFGNSLLSRIKNLKVAYRDASWKIDHMLEQCNFSSIWNEENSSGNSEENPSGNSLLSRIKNLKVTHCDASRHLKEMIFNYFRDKSRPEMLGQGYKDIILSKMRIQVSPNSLEFHRTIIVWHVATTLFFYSQPQSPREQTHLEETKNLSDYMLFLLTKRRYMLPVGAGLTTISQLLSEANQLFPRQPENFTEDEAANMLLEQLERFTQAHDQSVLVEACKIAKQLLSQNTEEMPKLLGELWVEIAGYAAAHCKADNHAQELRRGGEFLTQIWLLQAHFGLSDQFRHIQFENNPEIPENFPVSELEDQRSLGVFSTWSFSLILGVRNWMWNRLQQRG